MPSPAAIAGAFGHICNLVGFPHSIQAFFATTPGALTIDDLTHVARGEHARFFKTVTIADIETSHHLLYNVWIPTICDNDTITRTDLVDGGALYDTSTKLSDAITKLHRDLNALAAVFKQYERDLWIDELTRGYYAFIEGYSLLLHMHGVHHQLQSVKIGDKSIRGNMRSLQQYVADARSIMNFFYVDSDKDKRGKAVTGKVLDRRLRRIKTVEKMDEDAPINVRIFTKMKRTQDDYEPQKETPADFVLLRGFKDSNVSFNDRYNAVFRRTQEEVMISVKKQLDAVEKQAKEALTKPKSY